MRAAIVSTYPPRACGIGAFAADVRAALLGVEGVDRVERIVVVDEPSRPQRPGLVATIAQAVRGDYVRAARILGRLDVDVVLLQHEFGIFGGRDGEYVLSFAEELSQPLVVTLHTVLSEPTPHQAKVMSALCEQAEIDHRLFEREQIALAVAAGDNGMRPPGDDVQNLRVALDDRRECGDRGLEPVAG